MLARFSWLLTLPLTLVLVAFAVANRQTVAVNLWPFALEMQTPVFLLSLGCLFIGFAFGALLLWLSSLRHRLAARKLGTALAKAQDEIKKLQQEKMPVTTMPANSAASLDVGLDAGLGAG